MKNGIIQTISNNSFEVTYHKLKQALENNSKIKIVAELDHSKNAAKVNLTLSEARIILFGNPLLGTPIMNSNILAGLDLPQKFLVFKQTNDVIVAYNDPFYLKKRHQLTVDNQLLEKISNALKNLTKEAIN